MSTRIVVVDAFTDRPFSGNPAAVCVLPEARPELWMQQVAREMNLSETAFLVRQADGFDLRWFTPVAEVDLCGHATLGSAHVLWQDGILDPAAPAVFHTRSGRLGAQRQGEWIELDFPAEREKPSDSPDELLEGLSPLQPQYVGRNRLDYLVELASEEEVRSARPDFAKLARLGTRGVIVTAKASKAPYDFVSRYFAPAFGIPEDPVTGSTHCCLGPFWAERLGKPQLMAYQASERGGTLRLRIGGDRVYIGGQAVTVLRAELFDGTA